MIRSSATETRKRLLERIFSREASVHREVARLRLEVLDRRPRCETSSCPGFVWRPSKEAARAAQYPNHDQYRICFEWRDRRSIMSRSGLSLGGTEMTSRPRTAAWRRSIRRRVAGPAARDGLERPMPSRWRCACRQIGSRHPQAPGAASAGPRSGGSLPWHFPLSNCDQPPGNTTGGRRGTLSAIRSSGRYCRGRRRKVTSACGTSGRGREGEDAVGAQAASPAGNWLTLPNCSKVWPTAQ